MYGEQHYLNKLFKPSAVALIGATGCQNTIGNMLVKNLLQSKQSGYHGKIFFVTPEYSELYGQDCLSDLGHIPQKIDVAIVCTSADTILETIKKCAQAACRFLIVLSDVLSERSDSLFFEKQVIEQARLSRVRLLGPNCIGLIAPLSKLNMSYVTGQEIPLSGSVGLISQSNALCSSILDWASDRGVGFSAVVSMGTEIDIDFGDILDYMVFDEKTRSIVLYIESIHQARRFMSALRAAAFSKPVFVFRAGSSGEVASPVLASHGIRSIPNDLFHAVLKRSGVVQLASVEHIFPVISALFFHLNASGNRLVVISNGLGPALVALDRSAKSRVSLATLSGATRNKLKQLMPSVSCEFRYLIDCSFLADISLMAQVLECCLLDSQVDGALLIYSPSSEKASLALANQVVVHSKSSDKPIIACWMGGKKAQSARQLFSKEHISYFRTPSPAVDFFEHLSSFYCNKKTLMQVPHAAEIADLPRVSSANIIIESALRRNQTSLSEIESKAILAAFNVPTARSYLARNVEQAKRFASQIGLPVVMKIDAPQIRKKSEVGGVRLGVNSLKSVEEAFDAMCQDVSSQRPDASILGVIIEPMISKTASMKEMVIQSMKDPVFGPVIYVKMAGLGPSAKQAVALPPLDSKLIDDLIDSAPFSGLFEQAASSVSRQYLERILLGVSQMLCELPGIESLEVSPIMMDEHSSLVVDARIEIKQLASGVKRYDHMAIHPYPIDLVTKFLTKQKKRVYIRPVRPEDACLSQDFIRSLSAETKYFRFMNTVSELSHSQLIRLTQIDYDRDMALIACVQTAEGEKQVGVVRYAGTPDGQTCEFAIVIDDAWRGTGLGKELMLRLIGIAKRNDLSYMVGDILKENKRMLSFVKHLGFSLSSHPEDLGIKRGVLTLHD